MNGYKVFLLLGVFLFSTASYSFTQACDVRSFGAKSDGVTKNTSAIQSAIDQCPAGGTVLLSGGGVFISGTIRLKSNLTLRIEPGTVLRGSIDDADYPDLNTPTVNSQLNSCRKALIYAEGADNIVIEGGPDHSGPDTMSLRTMGTVDGSSDRNPHWQGPERTRPMAVFAALSHNVTIRNLQVINSGMWSVVNFENTNVMIDSVRVDSQIGPTRDGIDIVDCTHVTIQNCDILSEDDSICLKSGSSKGVHDVTVKNCEIRNSGVANALKLGTASVGSFDGIHFENIKIDSAKQAAMAVESVDGAILNDITFKDIHFRNAGTAFFVLLGQRQGSPSVGSISNVKFENIDGETNLNWGSVVSGTKIGSKVYSIKNLSFTNVSVKNLNGLGSVPAPPPEYSGQYPDPRMWSPMPSFGLFFRHVDGVTYQSTSLQGAWGDPRHPLVQDDVKNFKGQ
jgi:polygalacturonase